MTKNIQDKQNEQKQSKIKQDIELDIKAWKNNSNETFSYKDKFSNHKRFKNGSSCFIFRKNINCIEMEESQILDDNENCDLLLRIRKSSKIDNKYEIINPIPKNMKRNEYNINQLNNALWYIINYGENKNDSYTLNENDILKIGRKKYEVIKLNINNRNNYQNNDNNSEYNISQINAKKGSIFNLDIENYQYCITNDDNDNTRNNSVESVKENEKNVIENNKKNININIINTNYNNGNTNTINPNRGSMDFSNYKALNNLAFKNSKDNTIQYNKVKLINPKTPKKESIKTATVVKLTNHNSEFKNNISQDIYFNNLTKQDVSKNLFGDNKIFENKNNFLSTERIPKAKIMKPNNNLNINNNISDQNVIININNPIIANDYDDNKKNNIKYVENLNKVTKVKINNKIKNNDKNYENLKTEYNNNNPNKFLGACKIKKIEMNANKGQVSPIKINKIKVKQFFDKEIEKEEKILFHNISTNKIKSTSKGPFNRKQYLEENFEISK